MYTSTYYATGTVLVCFKSNLNCVVFIAGAELPSQLVGWAVAVPTMRLGPGTATQCRKPFRPSSNMKTDRTYIVGVIITYIRFSGPMIASH